jgi:hypothetical protein
MALANQLYSDLPPQGKHALIGGATMDKKHLSHFVLACIGILSVANVGFAQAVGNAPAPTPLLQKVAIGVGVWLVTAVLAYVAWTLLKVVAKIGVILIPVLTGFAVATLLPNQITSDAVMSIGVPCVTSAIAASLVCYLYANFYDIERELSKVEQSKVTQGTPSPPTSA